MSAAVPGGVVTIETPRGPARATIHRPPAAIAPRGSLVLGHGAGGQGPSRDLVALTALTGSGWVVALIDQPWRVAGRRVAGPPAQLDEAWLAIWPQLTGATTGHGVLPGPHIAGGRSAGARVVARTAARLRPDGLVLLSFPLDAPARRDGSRASRAPELAAAAQAGMPMLLVQGDSDSFGGPDRLRQVSGLPVTAGRGGHGFAGDAADVRDAVSEWLEATWG